MTCYYHAFSQCVKRSPAEGRGASPAVAGSCNNLGIMAYILSTGLHQIAFFDNVRMCPIKILTTGMSGREAM